MATPVAMTSTVSAIQGDDSDVQPGAGLPAVSDAGATSAELAALRPGSLLWPGPSAESWSGHAPSQPAG